MKGARDDEAGGRRREKEDGGRGGGKNTRKRWRTIERKTVVRPLVGDEERARVYATARPLVGARERRRALVVEAEE